MRPLILAALATFAMPAGLNAAVFAKFDGVDGESTADANHDKWIDVLSIDWGTRRPGGGASARRAGIVIDDFELTVKYDKAAPKLAEKCLRGEVIPKVEIHITETYGTTPLTYLKYELTNVMITSYQINASGSDEGPPTVVVGNNFQRINILYTERDETGASKGDTEVEWDVEQNIPGDPGAPGDEGVPGEPVAKIEEP